MKLIEKAASKGFRYTLLQGDAGTDVTALCYDSRKAEEGSLFVCMRGANFDSHEIIGELKEKGVRAVAVDRDCEFPEGITVIRTEDSREALAELSAAWFDFPAEKLLTVGVTGTKGKTTTTHMLKELLEKSGKKTGLIGTNGITIGSVHTPTKNTTPESYEIQHAFADMVKEGCGAAVMEVSSQGLMLHRTGGIRFDIGIFMNISPDHIGPNEHGSFEEYLGWKKSLFTQCRTALISSDDEHWEEVAAAASNCERVCTFSTKKKADFNASGLRYVTEKGFVGLTFTFQGPGEKDGEVRTIPDVRVGMPGHFNEDNALAALSAAALLGVKDEVLRNGLEKIRVNGRMEILLTHPFTVLVDYAHNAVSMESLLDTLREYGPKRLVVVFGCGGNRAKERRYSMGEIAGKKADLSIVTADNSRYEKVEDIIDDILSCLKPTGGAYVTIPDRRKAIFRAIGEAEPGDMIAVIGKGHEDYQEINGVRTHFLDREVAEEAIAARGL